MLPNTPLPITTKPLITYQEAFINSYNHIHTHHLKDNKPAIVTIIGATGSGKSSLAIKLCKYLNTHYKTIIINIDSRQCYKNTGLGTGALLHNEQQNIPHYGFCMYENDAIIDVYNYKEYVYNTIDNATNDGYICVLVGGSMMFIEAILENYDFNNGKHIAPFHSYTIGLEWPRDILYSRINTRTKQLLPHIINETKQLIHMNNSTQILESIGYKDAKNYLLGLINMHELKELVCKKTRHYAKKQLIWYRHRMQYADYIDMESIM